MNKQDLLEEINSKTDLCLAEKELLYLLLTANCELKKSDLKYGNQDLYHSLIAKGYIQSYDIEKGD